MNKPGKPVVNQSFSDAPPLIFLHAFPLNSRMWEPQIEYCQSKNINHVALDFPGFGGTPSDQNMTSMSKYSVYLHDTLTDLNITSGLLVGSSMGGYIALQFIHDYPDFGKGFILANSRTTADSPEIRENRMNMISELSSCRELKPVIESLLPKFLTSDTRASRPAIVKNVTEMMESASIEGIISAQKAMSAREDHTLLLENFKQPVCLIASDSDSLVSLNEYQDLANKLPAARLTVIIKAAHISNMERPEEFNAAMWDFVSENRLVAPE
jgi:pimeloyl-ACP methyl ester carboxylesterase